MSSMATDIEAIRKALYLTDRETDVHHAAWVALGNLAASLSAEPGWRPIEIAPKDGTEILVWIPQGRCWVTRWAETVNRGHGLYESGWVDFYANEPVYWQHLPIPPGDAG